MKVWKGILALITFKVFMDIGYPLMSITVSDYSWRDYGLFNSTLQNMEGAQYVVPKLIHRIWINETIPDEWDKPYQSCKREGNCPDYDTIVWSDVKARKFIKEIYPWFLETYDSYPWDIQRADALRYFVLYEYGGIYMDLDVGCRRNLDTLLAFDLILPKTNPIGLSNDLIISAPRHPFWEQVISALPRWSRGYYVKYLTIFFSTGPLFLSYQWSIFPEKTNSTKVLSRPLYGNQETSFFWHNRGFSWHGKDTFLFVLFEEYPVPAIGSVIVLIVVICWARYFINKRRARTLAARSSV